MFIIKITAIVVGILAAELVAAIWLVNRMAEGMIK